jgi:hypothetical protein
MCGTVWFFLNKAHVHCDCCEAMHACVGVSVWAWSRRHIGAIMLMCVCEHFPRVSAHTGAIMPTRVCTHRRDHAHVCMRALPTRVCSHRRDHAHTYTCIYARSCLLVYSHIGAIMRTFICTYNAVLRMRVCTRRRDHTHA